MAHISQQQIRSDLTSRPNYEPGTAYTRAKICCEVLTQLGHPIPSWMVIREIIEKGSSSDISRGVKDFRTEHADMLQRIQGMPEGIPKALSQPMQALWQSALAEATSLFDDQRRDLNAQQVEIEQEAEQAMAQRDTLAGELALATEKIAGLQLAVEQEKERANGEHSARLQAERMAQSHITDLTEQRNSMTLAVEANTGELRTLSTRLEDERRRAIMQIDEARQQLDRARQDGIRAGELKMVVLEKELRKEMSHQTLEHFYLQKRYSDLCAQTTKLRELLNKEDKPRSFRGKTLGKMLPGRAVRIKALRRRPSA